MAAAARSGGVDDELHAEVAVAVAGADEEVVPPRVNNFGEISPKFRKIFRFR